MNKDDTCCPTDATASAAPYAPRGARRTIGGLPCYVAGTLAPLAVLAVPDIFGLDAPASLRCLDELADAAGLPVVAVDYFRGAPWRLEDFPPKPGQSIGEWIGRTVPSAAVRRDTEAVLAALREEVSDKFVSFCFSSSRLFQGAAERVGVVGFCWGGREALAMAELFRCAASPHPSFVSLELAQAAAARTPLCLLPSRDEDEALYAQIGAAVAQSGKPGSFVRRFPEAPHGWCAARASFAPGSPELRDTLEALRVLATFFQQHG